MRRVFIYSSILAGSFLFASSGFASELRGVLRNNSGVKQLSEQRADKAINDFTAALGDLPFSGEVHLNMGNSFLASRDPERALSEYDQALRAARGDSRSERETRFRAYFNSAVVRTEMKQYEEALSLYQQALDIYPDSLETKTNMELLVQQMSDGQGGDNDQDQNQDKKDQSGKDQKKDEKDEGEGQDKKDQNQEPDKFENPRATPRPFKSGELSQQDAKRILDEMKRQEEQIRARMQNERVKERPPEKDW